MFNNNLLGLPLYSWALFFMIYSFLGWLLEVAYAYKNRGYFVNRGFLKGPLCPIYGFSAITLVTLLNGFKENIFILFIAGTLLTTLLEYVTAVILETTFHTKWWDYTEDPFNFQGRICLLFSLLWGGVSVLVVKFVHPFIVSYILMLPTNFSIFIYWILLLCFTLDLGITLNNLLDFNDLTSKFEGRFTPLIRKHSDSLKNIISTSADTLVLFKKKNKDE